MASHRIAKPDGDEGRPRERASEVTPLLATAYAAPAQDPDVAEAVAGGGGAAASRNDDDGDRPLPRGQIFLLCYARIVEPVAFFSIFPYINQMLLHVSPDLAATDVGFYSGLIESLFSLTQMVVMLFWGRVADRYGRKPVLVASLAGICVMTSIFGLATNLWQMVLFRCLAGVFAGSVVTIRTMISERSTPRTQARAFSFFAFASNLGIVAGPMLGGLLAEPAKQFPAVLGHVQFFHDFPYALPNFATGLVALSAVFTSYFYVEETLVRKRTTGDAGENGEDVAAAPVPMTTWELVKAPGVAIVLLVFSHLMLLAFAYTAIISVFWFTPIERGGFSFDHFWIGMFMSLNGVSQALWLLLIFPPLQHRLGTNGVIRACANAYPFFLGFSAVLNLLLRRGFVTAFWVLAPLATMIGPGVSMSFTGIQLALNDVSPSPETLGTLNALALTAAAGIRAFAPALFASLFAVGARTQVLWGYMVWLVLVVLALLLTVGSRYLPAASEKDYPEEAEPRENGTSRE